MIRPTNPTLASVVAVAASMIVLGTSAWASPKVALTVIDGDSKGDVRDAVASALDGDELSLIGEKETNRAADKIGDLSELSEKDAKKLSSALEADALILGSLGKKGTAKVLKFKLFVNGKKTKGFSVQFTNAKSPKFKQALRNKMVEKIGVIEEAEKPEEAEKAPKGEKLSKAEREKAAKAEKAAEKAEKAEREKAEKAEKAAESDEDGEKRSKKKVAAADADDEDPNPKATKKQADKGSDSEADGDGDTEKSDSEDEDEPRKAKKQVAAADDEEIEETAIAKRMEPKRSANRVAARLDVGMSLANRTLKFTSRPDFPEGPRHFKSSPVPGARFDAEVYPLAFVNPKSFFSGLGLAVAYDKTLALNLGTSAEADVGKKIPVEQTALAVGGRMRFVLGKTASAPTVTVGMDYGRRRFKADRSVLTDQASLDLPDTHYKFFAPGLGFRIPFTPSFAFVAYGNGMLVTDAGPIQKADSYGKAEVFGIGTMGGFDIVFANRFALRLAAEFTQIGFSFVGVGGAQSNGRDGNPMTKDIGGAADRSYGGSATLGVLY